MDKLKAILQVFQKGSTVADPEAWKKGQITIGVLTSLISSVILLSKSFGYEIPITDGQEAAIATIALFIFGLFHPIATVVTSEEIGVPSNGGDSNNKANQSEFLK